MKDLPMTPCAVTDRLVQMLRESDTRGAAEYGTTVDRTDLSPLDWIDHATAENLDSAKYLQALRRTLETSAQPAAAQEAVGWQWRWLDTDNTWSEWADGGSRKEIDARIARWKADGEDHRMQVRPVFAAPVTAAPADTWFADQLTAMGEVIPLDGAPAAPGIDPDAVERLRNLAAYAGAAGCPSMGGDIKALLDALDASPKGDLHADDLAVDAFAAAMKAKLADARAKGRGGWQDDEPGMQQRLSDMLRAHVEKGDPRDVANFCMFLHQRGEAIGPKGAAPAIQVPAGWALVPDRMQLTPENMELLADTLRGADEDEPWCGGVLWVGQTTDDDGEPTYYGLNVGNVECLEEGSINIVEFDPPAGSPKGGSEAVAAWEDGLLDADSATLQSDCNARYEVCFVISESHNGIWRAAFNPDTEAPYNGKEVPIGTFATKEEAQHACEEHAKLARGAGAVQAQAGDAEVQP